VILPNKVQVIEIGPRDGFQSVKEWIPTEFKLEIIDGIVKSGFKKVQVTSFVHPKAIPQMKDAKVVAATAAEKYPDVNFFALTPNFYGANSAWESGLREITYVISVSETHNKANVNRTHEESFDELKKIKDKFPEMTLNLDVATAFGCPFDGVTPLDKLIDFIGRGVDIGIDYFTICDTIGVAYPTQVEKYITEVIKTFPDKEFSIHIHDTRNMGIVNTLTAIKCGITKVETAIGGLGGCPFAPGASGNTSSEDLIYMLNKMGVETNVDFDSLLATAKKAKENIKGNFSGHHINITVEWCG
jgi:hydroxymethylglutaryl-CoA lyase